MGVLWEGRLWGGYGRVGYGVLQEGRLWGCYGRVGYGGVTGW